MYKQPIVLYDYVEFLAAKVIFSRGDLSLHVSRTSGMCGVGGKEEIKTRVYIRLEYTKTTKKCSHKLNHRGSAVE